MGKSSVSVGQTLLHLFLEYLSDLGSASLIAQKLFSTSLIIPLHSPVFWISIPAILLVDVPLIALLQLSSRLFDPSVNNASTNHVASDNLDLFQYVSSLFSLQRRWPFIIFNSHPVEAQEEGWIPLSTQDHSIRDISSPAITVFDYDLQVEVDSHRSSFQHPSLGNNNLLSGTSRPIASSSSNDTLRNSRNHPDSSSDSSDDEDDSSDDEFNLHETFNRHPLSFCSFYASWEYLVFISQFVTPRFCALLMLLVVLVSVNAILFLLSLLTIAPYIVHEVVWSWEEAIQNIYNLSELAFLASRSEYVPTFIFVSTVLLVSGCLFCVMRILFIKYVFTTWRIVAASCAFYLAMAIFLRPPPSVVATNILLDGLFALVKYQRYDFIKNYKQLAKAPWSYMTDNHQFDKLFYLGRGEGVHKQSHGFDHVMVVFLENADKLAWPFTRQFCEQRNCRDLDLSLNVTHFTPFFYNLTRQSFDVPLFKANVPFTTKSHWSTLCGQMHMAHDMTTEFKHPWPLPCLPNLLKMMDSNFTTAFIESSTTLWDNQNIMLEQEGFDFIWNKEKIDQEYGGEREMTNYWGYADHEAHPAIFKWVDEQIENNRRMLLVHSTTTMHDPFSLPSGFESTEYTQTTRVNGYLNVIKYTDTYLQKLIEGLDKRGILDSTLLIVQGDHGPRINWNGETQDDDSALSHPTPLIFATPYTRGRPVESHFRNTKPLSTPVKWTSIDVLPTLLDVMGVNSSIWSQYMGQSILRPQNKRINRTFHTCAPGGRGPQIHEGNRVVVRKWQGDMCGFDLDKDPKQLYGWCLNSPLTNSRGWMEAKDPITGAFRSGESDWPDVDEKNVFKGWVRHASIDLMQSISLNEAWWQGGKSVDADHIKARQDFDELVLKLKAEGHLWM